jgi:hypothetical protein
VAGSAKATTDHQEIRRWAEARGGHPACVKGTRENGREGCMLRISFREEDSLEPMSWDEWFDIFEENQLTFLHQDMKGKQISRFNKLVSRQREEV